MILRIGKTTKTLIKKVKGCSGEKFPLRIFCSTYCNDVERGGVGTAINHLICFLNEQERKI